MDAAEQGDALSISFLTFALDALGDVGLARDVVTKYVDERRLSGLFALGRIKSADLKRRRLPSRCFCPFTEAGADDVVRCNALMSVFNICEQFVPLASTAVPRVVAAAAVTPGPLVQLNLVRAAWLHAKRIDRGSMKAALDALRVIDPTKAGIVHELDNALSTLLKLPDCDLALDFLTDILSPDNSGFVLEQFENVKYQIATGDRDRLFKLVVRWPLTGNHKLCCRGASDRHDWQRPGTVQRDDPGSRPHERRPHFLAYKAMGYLFTNPVVTASIMVASLRDCDKATAKTLGDLLFDPLMVNYGGKAKELFADHQGRRCRP